LSGSIFIGVSPLTVGIISPFNQNTLLIQFSQLVISTYCKIVGSQADKFFDPCNGTRRRCIPSKEVAFAGAVLLMAGFRLRRGWFTGAWPRPLYPAAQGSLHEDPWGSRVPGGRNSPGVPPADFHRPTRADGTLDALRITSPPLGPPPLRRSVPLIP